METIDQMTGDQADDDDSPVVIVEDHHGLFAEIVIADHRWLDLLDGDFRARLAAAFRRSGADHVLIMHHSATYTMAARLAGIPHRWGYGIGSSRRWMNRGS